MVRLLIESGRLGGGQTLASQGLIHGGLKYALSGLPSPASEAISAMPERWRACLEGRGEMGLTGLEPLSRHYYLFAAESGLGPLAAFLASKLLHGRALPLQAQDFPPFLPPDYFRGKVYRLDDFVLDPRQLTERLARLGAPHLYVAAQLERIETDAPERIAEAAAGYDADGLPVPRTMEQAKESTTFAEPRPEWVDAQNDTRAQAGPWVKNLHESLAWYDIMARPAAGQGP